MGGWEVMKGGSKRKLGAIYTSTQRLHKEVSLKILRYFLLPFYPGYHASQPMGVLYLHCLCPGKAICASI